MKKFVAFMLALSMLFVFAGCGAKESAEPEPDAPDVSTSSVDDMEYTEWSMANYQAATSIYGIQLNEMADAIYERTNGKLKINVFHSGELPFNGYEFVQIIADGTVQMAAIGSGYFETDVCKMLALPGMLTSNDELLTGYEAAKPYIEEELGAFGVTPLGVWSMMGCAVFGTGETPASYADMKGLKIRVAAPEVYDVMTPYGIEPVSIAWAEVIPSMQRGVCDGGYTAILSAWDAGWADVVDWGMACELQGGFGLIGVSEAAMSALPEDVQQIVREEVLNMQNININYNEENYSVSRQNFIDAGVEMVDIATEDQAAIVEIAKSVWDSFAEDKPAVQEALPVVCEALGK